MSFHPESPVGAPNLPGPASPAHQGAARWTPVIPQFPLSGRPSPTAAASSFLPRVSNAPHSSQNTSSVPLAKKLRWSLRARFSGHSPQPPPAALRRPPAPRPCNTPGFSVASPPLPPPPYSPSPPSPPPPTLLPPSP